MSVVRLRPEGGADEILAPVQDAVEKQRAAGKSIHLDRFELVRLLGKGGMGDVWMAHDTRLGRDVAIKVLFKASTDAATMHRFQREIRTLASLNHPAIAQIYEAGEAAWPGETPEHHVSYLVMEHVSGEMLSRRLGRGPMPVREAVGIISRLVEGLADAHDRMLVHRDIKPANIMISDDGEVKLLDLGLARLMVAAETDREPTRGLELDEDRPVNPDSTLSRAGMWIGTPKYMSPEQVAGRRADARADIWSVGLVLYEMLSGQRAIKADTSVKAMLSVTQFKLDERTLPEETPPRLIRVLRRCLQQDRRLRYHHARDLLHDLQDVLTEQRATVIAEQTQPSQPLTRIGFVLAMVAALAVTATAGWQLLFHSPRTVRHPTRGATILPFDGESPALTPRGDQVAFLSASGREIWVAPVGAGNPQKVFTSESTISTVVVYPDGHALVYDEAEEDERSEVFRIPITGGSPQKITRGWAPAVSNSGDVVSCFDRNEEGLIGLVVCRYDGTDRRYVYPLDGHLKPLSSCFTPDDGSILVSRWDRFNLSQLQRVDLSTGDAETVEYHEGSATKGLSVLPDGSAALWCIQGISASAAMVGITSLSRGGFLPVFPGSGMFSFPSLSTVGSVLLVRTNEEPIKMAEIAVDPLSDSPSVAIEEIPFSIGSCQPRTSPDLKRIVFTATEWDLWIYNRERQDSEHLVSIGEVAANPAWSPDGSQVVYSGQLDGQSDLWIVEADGSGVWRLTDTPQGDFHPCWHPNGSVILWICDYDGTMLLQKIDVGTRRIQTLGGESVFNPAISPNGRFIAFVCRTRKVLSLRLHHLTEEVSLGPLIWKLDGREQEWAGFNPRFSPDGVWLGFDVPRDPAGSDLYAVPVDTTGSRELVQLTAFPFVASIKTWWDWIGPDRVVVSIAQKRGRLVLLREADLWINRVSAAH